MPCGSGLSACGCEPTGAGCTSCYLVVFATTCTHIGLNRREKENRHNFITMLLSSLLQFVVFVEEVLVAINLDLNGRLSWPAVFVPLYILSVVSLVACIFSCCTKRCNVEVTSSFFVFFCEVTIVPA